MYLVKTPSIVKPLAKEFLWSISTSEKEIYLTFDDGPTPGVTNKVLDLLKSFSAHGTFFCLGKNVLAYPDIYKRIRSEGHSVGNHTWDHPDGWKTNDYTYLKNIARARKVIDTALFRPPYGRITPSQVRAIKNKFQLVMWSVLSADFDKTISKEQCLSNVLNNTENGSIIVFHDSEKAKENMLYALEECLEFFTNEGYTLRAITQR